MQRTQLRRRLSFVNIGQVPRLLFVGHDIPREYTQSVSVQWNGPPPKKERGRDKKEKKTLFILKDSTAPEKPTDIVDSHRVWNKKKKNVGRMHEQLWGSCAIIIAELVTSFHRVRQLTPGRGGWPGKAITDRTRDFHLLLLLLRCHNKKREREREMLIEKKKEHTQHVRLVPSVMDDPI